jgi:hypothetical protein
VAEPLLDWLDLRWAEWRRYDYLVEGVDLGALTVRRRP